MGHKGFPAISFEAPTLGVLENMLIGLTQLCDKLVFVRKAAHPLPPSLARGEGPKGGGSIPQCVESLCSKERNIPPIRDKKYVFAVG